MKFDKTVYILENVRISLEVQMGRVNDWFVDLFHIVMTDSLCGVNIINWLILSLSKNWTWLKVCGNFDRKKNKENDYFLNLVPASLSCSLLTQDMSWLVGLRKELCPTRRQHYQRFPYHEQAVFISITNIFPFL